ncbi:PiggyBac transposable element-derived protein 4 [Cucumispora dikerogammari]|nr:PiggyBac transposable element-derived protein 4 [Cucumispora dikerogammari]
MPLALKKYNEYMGGVDLCDQMTKYYSSATKAQSWIRKIAFNFLEIALYNSFVLYCKNIKKITLLEYKRQITNILLSDWRNDKGNKTIEKDEKTDVLFEKLILDKEKEEYIQLGSLEKLVINKKNSLNIHTSKGNEENSDTNRHIVMWSSHRRACKRCYRHNKSPKLVSTYCETCNMFLCVKECFHKHHLSKI